MKNPNSKNYVGNPMGYFNDKALYGREMLNKAQTGQEIATARQQRLDNKLERKKTRAEIAAEKAKIRNSRHSNRKNGRKEATEFRRKMQEKDVNTERLRIIAENK